MRFTITEGINIIIWSLGIIFLILILFSIYFDDIKPAIKSWWKRTNKIRCLCKHEYVDKFHWSNPFYTKYELECRLCDKKKIFIIYEDDEVSK